MKKFVIVLIIPLGCICCNNTSYDNNNSDPTDSIQQMESGRKNTHIDTTEVRNKSDSLREDFVVLDPISNAVIHSPVTIRGKAKGSWFFEGSFPVELYDAENNKIARGTAQSEGNWMTQKFVPFSVTLDFAGPRSRNGKLVFRKDNPSGLKENEASVVLPVRF